MGAHQHERVRVATWGGHWTVGGKLGEHPVVCLYFVKKKNAGMFFCFFWWVGNVAIKLNVVIVYFAGK